MAGVHRVVILGFICLRAGSLAQLAIAFTSGSLSRAEVPWVSATSAVLLIVESVGVCVLMWRGGSATRPDLVAVDVITLCLLYGLQVIFASDTARAVTWEGWVFGVGVGFLIPIACLPSWRATTLTGFLVVAAYWVTVLPDALHYGQAATVLASGSGLVANIVGMRLIWTFLSRLGTRADVEADAARQARAQLALENQRIMHELHSQTGSLTAFLRDVDPSRLAGSPEELKALTDTLWVSATRARAELSGLLHDQDHDFESLGSTLQRVAHECGSVHVTCTTYQVDDLTLPADTLGAVGRGVATLLENVAHHSGAREATVYARLENGRFEVTVTDTGSGFDPTTTPWGLGLSKIAGEHLTHHQIDRTIRSAPGQGTTITLSAMVDLPSAAPEHRWTAS